MVQLQKVVVEWTGFPGAPGYSVFYRGEDNVLTAALRTFYESVKTVIPTNVNIQVASSGDVVDSVTGALSGNWTSPANTVVDCTGAGSYGAPAGAMVKWLTSAIVNGRRLRGKTFLVPIISSAMETDGSINFTLITQIQNAAAALLTSEAGNLGVWHRPVNSTGGSWSPITSAVVPDRVAVLRSRRD